MKRFPRAAAASFGLFGFLGLASLPVACVSSSTPSAPTGDSGAPPLGDDAASPGPDATVPDGGATDSGADVANDSADAAPAPLTVKVLLGSAPGTPEQGVLVVFQDSTGAVLSSTTTDATGTVSELVTAGSQVTVVMGTTLVPNVVTIQAVEPGDALTFVDTSGASSSSLEESVSVTLPAPDWDASGVTEYMTAGTCGDPSADPVFVSASCESNGQFPLLAYAQGQGGQEVAYTFQTGNDLLEDGGPTSITVSRPWATPTATESITTSALPAATDDVTFTYAEVQGGVVTSILPVTDETDDAGVATSIFTVHQGFPDYVQAEAYAIVGQDDGNTVTAVGGATRSAPPSTSQTASLDLSVLPPITAANADSTDAGTLAQPTVTWTSAGSLSNAAGIIATFQWNQSPPPDAGDENVNGTWTIVAPATATSVQAPAMPGGAWVPSADAGAYVGQQPRVVAVQGSLLPTYATVRAQFAGLSLFAAGWQATLPLLPANGTIVVSVIYPNEG